MSQYLSQFDDHEQQTYDWFAALLGHLNIRRQRLLLSLQGDQVWCDQMLVAVKSQYHDCVTLSDRIDEPTSVPFSKANTLLGQEASIVIVDLFQGLNPDVVCIAGGLVKCGGLLLLLSPPPQQWSDIEDHYGVWQDKRLPELPLFVEYFFNNLSRDPVGAAVIMQDESLPSIPDLPSALEVSLDTGKTTEQIEVQRQVDDWLQKKSESIALITADRGRGKSTCLGFIAAEQKAYRQKTVLVTAASRQAAAILLEQVRDADFVAPDKLIATAPPADMLVIDEAAMLPYPMLNKLCKLYPKIIMATTTGGYEGTGQGFLLRFIARLPQNQLLRAGLTQPVRWASNDCLENWLTHILLLKSPLRDEQPEDISASSFRYRVIDSKACSKEEGMLTEIYGLMVSAHYRTRPSDLRMLMENPDLSIVLAEVGGRIVGVALLNREGGFDLPLCEQVFLGKRRPMGHLLAQMLTAQAGIRHFAQHQGLRIQRIAVHANLRRKGLGRGLVETATQYAQSRSLDYIGASFAFEAETSAFWKACGFSLVHIGFGQGKSSGMQSVAVLKSLSPDIDHHVGELQERIQNLLAVWLCQFLQQMDIDSVIALLRYSQYQTVLNQLEKNEIEAFTKGHKGFELCFASLQRFVMQGIACLPEDASIHPWLIEKVVQNKDWDQLERGSTEFGRKQAQRKLRQLVAEFPL